MGFAKSYKFQSGPLSEGYLLRGFKAHLFQNQTGVLFKKQGSNKSYKFQVGALVGRIFVERVQSISFPNPDKNIMKKRCSKKSYKFKVGTPVGRIFAERAQSTSSLNRFMKNLLRPGTRLGSTAIETMTDATFLCSIRSTWGRGKKA